MQPQGGVGILGDRLHRDAADLVKGGALDDGAGTAEEAGVPHVVAILHQAVEEGPLVRHLAKPLQVVFERIGGEEVVGVWTTPRRGSR